MTDRDTEQSVELGRKAEREDVLAWFDRVQAANARVGERGDEAARLAGHRMAALRDGIAAGVHVGESGGD